MSSKGIWRGGLLPAMMNYTDRQSPSLGLVARRLMRATQPTVTKLRNEIVQIQKKKKFYSNIHHLVLNLVVSLFDLK